MERYLCSVYLHEMRNFSVFDVLLMTTDDDHPQFVLQFKDSSTNWFEEFSVLPHRAEIAELLCLPNHPVTMKALCEKPGRVPSVLRFFLHSHFFDQAVHTVTRSEIEFQQTFQNFLNAFESFVFIEPTMNLQFNVGVLPALPKPKNNLKYSLQAERHISKEQLDTAHKVMEVLTRSPIKHCYHLGIQVSDTLYFVDGNLTSTPPIHTMENDKALLIYTKGFGRRRSLAQVCDSIVNGAMDAGTRKTTSYFHQFGFLNAPHCALVLCKDSDIEKWSNEIEESIVIKEKCDLDLITFDVLTAGTTIVVSESAVQYCKEQERNTFWTMQELFAKESAYSISRESGTRATLDDAKCKRFYVGSIGQRHLHAVIPLMYAHFRCILIDEGLEKAKQCFSTEFSLYNAGYSTLLPAYPERVPFIQNNPHCHRILNDPNSGMIIRSSIPQTTVRKISFLPSAVVLSPQEKKFIQRMQKIASTRSVVNRYLDISDIVLGGEFNDIAGCCFSLALARQSPMTREDAELNIKKHFALFNGTLGQRLLNDFNVLDEEFASRSYVKQQLNDPGTCLICFSKECEVMTLCGHALCKECKDMLTAEDQLLFKCPKCRSTLTHYDFIEFDASSSETPVSETSRSETRACSKFMAIVQALETLFCRRRSKKRCLTKKALIIVPSKCILTLKTQLEELHKYQLNWDANETLHRILILSYEDFDENLVDETLEGILLACPAKKTEFYFDLMKSCRNRSFPLPLHIFFAQGMEEITETIDCLVNLKH